MKVMLRVLTSALVAGVALLVMPTAALGRASTSITGWVASPLVDFSGHRITVKVRVKSGAVYTARTIRLESSTSAAGPWATLSTVNTTSAGRATLAYAVPNGVTLVRATVVATRTAPARSTAPRPLRGTPTQRVSVGGPHACALDQLGRIGCWGANDSGQFGDGSRNDSLVAVPGPSLNVVSLAANESYTCALTSAGGVACWGGNILGEPQERTLVPVDIPGLASGVAAIAAGGTHVCVLTTRGSVKCWGGNGYGQVGNGTLSGPVTTPVDVTGLGSGVVALGAGSLHTCAVLANGTVRCWGSNASGQLGSGGPAQSSVPISVGGLTSDVVAVAGGAAHTCALHATGGMSCWGLNSNGQLGNGTTTDSATAVSVSGLADASSVAAGWFHTCATTTTGAVCWGLNTYGQLGNGTISGSSTPVVVRGLAWRPIWAGGHTTCARLPGTPARTACWGYNGSGQVGNGSTTNATSPATVISGFFKSAG